MKILLVGAGGVGNSIAKIAAERDFFDPRTTGEICAGVWVTGTGVDGKPHEVYLYHVSDNEWTMAYR